MANYVEDQPLTLDLLENGVVAIGDLWNCREEKSVGHNLFGNNLNKKYLIAYPAQDLEYNVTHCKSMEDKLKALGLSVEFSVPILGGFIIITGGVGFDYHEGKRLGTEEVICNYQRDAFVVKICDFKDIQDAIDPAVKSMVTNGNLGATHVVVEVVTGAKATAKVTIPTDAPKDRIHFKGTVKGTANLYVASATIGASLWITEEGDKSKTTTTINLKSVPPTKRQPTNLDEVYKTIQSISIENERHFPMFEDVKGVPIRFKLVPVAQFVAQARANVYQVIPEEMMIDLVKMFATLKDFQVYEYIKERVLEKDSRLLELLSDPGNTLTTDISSRENELRVLTVQFQSRAYHTLGLYKLGETTITELEQIIVDFKNEFDLIGIHQEVNSFVQEGRVQILTINSSEVIPDEHDVTFFTNVGDLRDWMDASKGVNKVLLQTKSSKSTDLANPDGGESRGQRIILSEQVSFLTLYEMSKNLKLNGIEVGVALPNISSNFSLTIKIQNKAVEYTGGDVSFALHQLGIGVGKGERVETQFHAVNAALFGYNRSLHESNVSEMNNLISLIQDCRDIIICESLLQLRDRIARFEEGTLTWKFILPVDGIDALADSVASFKRFKSLFVKTFKNITSEWIVGSFGLLNFQEAPYMFVFLNNSLKAICMDHFDVIVFLDRMKEANPDFEILAPMGLQNPCMYPERYQYASVVSTRMGEHVDLTNFSTGSFVDKKMENDNLMKTISITRDMIGEDFVQVASTGAKIALGYDEFKDFIEVLLKNHWDETDEQFHIPLNDLDAWMALHTDLFNYFYTHDSFLSKLDMTVMTFQEYASDKQTIEEQIQKVIDDEDCPLKLKVDLENILRIDIEDKETEVERLKILLSVLEIFAEFFRSNVEFTDVNNNSTEDYVAKYKLIRTKIDDSILVIKQHLYPHEDYFPHSIVKDLLIHPNLKGDIKNKLEEELAVFADCINDVKIEATLYIFEKCKEEIISKGRFVYLQILIDFVNQLSVELPGIQFQSDILTRYINQLDNENSRPDDKEDELDDEKNRPDDDKNELDAEKLFYAGTLSRVVSYAKKNSFYQCLCLLKKLTVHPALYMIRNEINSIEQMDSYSTGQKQSSSNERLLIRIVKNMADLNVTTQNLIDFWSNPKLALLMRQGLNYSSLLYTIQTHQWKDSSLFLPKDFEQAIKALNVTESFQSQSWEKIWPNFENMLQVLKALSIRGIVPHDFQTVLFNNIYSNLKLKQEMQECGALFFWNDEEQLFMEPWDFNVIREVCLLMNSWMESKHQDAITNIKFSITADPDLEDASQKPEEIIVIPMWKPVTGGTLMRVKYTDYKLEETLLLPKVAEEEMETFMKTVIDYVLQNIRMMDVDVLDPSQVSLYVEKLRSLYDPRPGEIHLDSDDESAEISPVSRLDVLTCLFSSVDPVLALELLQIMAQFPIAMPFLIPDVTEKESYTILTPLLQQLYFHWDSETSEGSAVNTFRNNLFRNKFRMIVTVRLGDNPACGKSVILNELFKNNYTFSSRQEPGAQTGKPKSLPGFVEFIWLSKSACNRTLWNSVEQHSRTNELILLANLHGDCLAFPETLKLLSQFASSFLIFTMPTNWNILKYKTSQFRALTGNNFLHILVDPLPDCLEKIKDADFILTSDEHKDARILKVSNVISSTLSWNSKHFETIDLTDLPDFIKPSQGIYNYLSNAFLQLVKKDSSKLVKDTLELQTRINRLSVTEFNLIWTRSEDLRKYMSLFASVLHLPIENRYVAFVQLAHNFENKAKTESIFEEIESIKLDLGKVIENRLEVSVNMQNHLKDMYRKLHIHTLYLEDFFTELSIIYDMASHQNSLHPYPALNADQVQCGNPILLPFCGKSPWFSDTFAAIVKNYNPRIFVISMLGLHDTEKSALFNSVFGSRFEIHRTESPYVTLIYLDAEMKSKLNIDAILLIDTPFLSPPENLNNAEASKIERQIMTFAFSLSNLILVCTNGSINSITDSLELVFVALTRQEKLFSPDILIIEQLLETQSDEEPHSNSSNLKNTNILIPVNRALEIADDVTKTNELEIGVVENVFDKLHSVKERLENKTLVVTLRAQKVNGIPSINHHEDVEYLKSQILDAVQDNNSETLELSEWLERYEMVSNWLFGKDSSFPCDMTDIQELRKLIDVKRKFGEVKFAIDLSFTSHLNILRSQQFSEIVNIDVEEFLKLIAQNVKQVLGTCKIEGNGTASCELCRNASEMMDEVHEDMKLFSRELRESLEIYIRRKEDNLWQILVQQMYAYIINSDKMIPPEFEDAVEQFLRSKLQQGLENEEIVVETLHFLKQLISTKSILIPVKRLIQIEIMEEYQFNQYITEELLPSDDDATNFNSSNTRVSKAEVEKDKDKISSVISWREDEWLQEELEDTTNWIIEDAGADEDNQIFHIGMIRQLKEKFADVTEDFEIRHKVFLSSNTKWDIHVLGINTFINKVLGLQDKWNERFNPIVRFTARETKFREKILQLLQQLIQE